MRRIDSVPVGTMVYLYFNVYDKGHDVIPENSPVLIIGNHRNEVQCLTPYRLMTVEGHVWVRTDE